MIENEHIEFKRSSGEARDAMKSVCGMLNKYGEGTIYFGLDNNGKPVKNVINDSSFRDISRAVFESIEPKITPVISIVKIDNVDVIELKFHGELAPYSCKGVYYNRSADENRPMSQQELLLMFQSRGYEDDWEKKIGEFTENDINDNSLMEFFKAAKKAKRIDLDEYNKLDVLTYLDLIKDGYLNNAGYFLFGKNPNVEIKLATYLTKEKVNFIDLKSIKGNIYDLVGIAIDYIKAHINWRVEIGERKRTEIPEIPEKAIREIVVNSFAHAKYGSDLTHEINIFPDLIEIINSGNFPERYTPEDFIEKRISSLKRNPLILDVLFRSRDVEKSGSGFSRVNNLCKLFKVKRSYERLPFGFKFIFYRNNVSSIPIVKENGASNLTEEETIVLNAIDSNNKIKVEEIAVSLNVSVRKVQRIIKSLVGKNYIERIGTKGGYWKILKSEN